MSGGSLPYNLSQLPSALAAKVELHGPDMDPLVAGRLLRLIDEVDRLKRVVVAADKLIAGDIGEATFNFVWNSEFKETDGD